MSGAGYTIYANGWNEFKFANDQNELSGWENATDFTGAAIPWTIPYDGFLSIFLSGSSEVYSRLYINNIEISQLYGESGYQTIRQVVPVKKGDVVSGNVTINAIRCSFYKKRDYSNR